jgi:hypothetical protein
MLEMIAIVVFVLFLASMMGGQSAQMTAVSPKGGGVGCVLALLVFVCALLLAGITAVGVAGPQDVGPVRVSPIYGNPSRR